MILQTHKRTSKVAHIEQKHHVYHLPYLSTSTTPWPPPIPSTSTTVDFLIYLFSWAGVWRLHVEGLCIPFLEPEYCLWEDPWMLLSEKLQSWEALYELARQENLNVHGGWKIGLIIVTALRNNSNVSLKWLLLIVVFSKHFLCYWKWIPTWLRRMQNSQSFLRMPWVLYR